MNEANEMRYEDFLQLALRTTGTIFLDYNPSDIDHWIYDRVLTREDSRDSSAPGRPKVHPYS